MQTNRELRASQQFMAQTNSPPGIIVLWPQNKDIPLGYQRCDGTNGTVNISIVVGGVAIYIQKVK